ncbi:hypothetical protein ACNKHT_15975 [Shigella flexneri]
MGHIVAPGRIAMVLSAEFVPMAFFGAPPCAPIASSLLPLLRRWCCQYW